jgi:hemin uptake protein HemP
MVTLKYKPPTEIIRGPLIIIDGRSVFPKKLVIKENGKKSEYRLVKTRTGAYMLNK